MLPNLAGPGASRSLRAFALSGVLQRPFLSSPELSMQSRTRCFGLAAGRGAAAVSCAARAEMTTLGKLSSLSYRTLY